MAAPWCSNLISNSFLLCSVQMQHVKELSAQIEDLRRDNNELRQTNDRVMRNLSSANSQKANTDNELQKCTARLVELQTVVRLQKRGNRNLEKECERAKKDADDRAAELVCFCKSPRLETCSLPDRGKASPCNRSTEISTGFLRQNRDLPINYSQCTCTFQKQIRTLVQSLEKEKSKLEQSLSQHLDINGNFLFTFSLVCVKKNCPRLDKTPLKTLNDKIITGNIVTDDEEDWEVATNKNGR